MSATTGTYVASTATLAGASGTAGAAAISSGMATVGSLVGGGIIHFFRFQAVAVRSKFISSSIRILE